MMLDSHAHLSTGDVVRYPPAPAGGSRAEGDLDDPMTAERLLGEMDQNGVERAMLVQRTSIYGYDNSYVCDAAAAHPARFKAVCSIDAEDPNAADRVRYWMGERGAAGVRVMEPKKGVDLSWLGAGGDRAFWRAANALGAPVSVHFFRWNRDAGLQALAEVVRAFQGVSVVIDHFSNMASESGPPDHGLDRLLLDFVEHPGVCVKYTTIPLGALERDGLATAPVVARVVSAFGADRVMWGSDISQSKGDYAYMTDLGRRSTELLPQAAREQVLFRTASDVYGW